MFISVYYFALSSVISLDTTLPMKLRYAKAFYPGFYPCSILWLCNSTGAQVLELMPKITLNLTCYFYAQIRTGRLAQRM